MSQADHHLGGSDSPPGRHKALYDFLPNARSGSVPGEKRVALKKQIPKRIVIEIPVMSHRDDRDSTQNLQPRIIGVYELVRTYDPQGVSGRKAPVWKHCREDLAIQQGDVEGEKGWIIALATSLHNQATPPKVCARVHGAELPHVGTERLQAWDPFKSKWKWCQDVKLRPTYHGWGLAAESSGERLAYMSNVTSSFGSKVMLDTNDGGARMRTYSPHMMRSVLAKPMPGDRDAASAPFNEYKVKYASPYSFNGGKMRMASSWSMRPSLNAAVCV